MTASSVTSPLSEDSHPIDCRNRWRHVGRVLWRTVLRDWRGLRQPLLVKAQQNSALLPETLTKTLDLPAAAFPPSKLLSGGQSVGRSGGKVGQLAARALILLNGSTGGGREGLQTKDTESSYLHSFFQDFFFFYQANS